MIYRKLLRPVLFKLPPELAHELALRALMYGLGSSSARRLASARFASCPFGKLRRVGLEFANPVGLAAGFDKNGVVVDALSALGFGFLELGTVTHLAQPGNPKPRLFRLPLDQALINRQGFNNHGAAALAAQLAPIKPRLANVILGINIGKSKAVPVEAAVDDYVASFDLIHQYADYVTVNVSSPNTPNLRELQRAPALDQLLGALQQRNRALSGIDKPVPVLLKIAPDVDDAQLQEIAQIVIQHGIAGIVATNTTVRRDGLRSDPALVARCGEGGLSGAPLRSRSTELIAKLYRLSKGRFVVIGVGGVFSAADAWEKICAGASLVQLYTGLVYNGIGVARSINQGLAQLLQQAGLTSLDEAVGSRSAELG